MSRSGRLPRQVGMVAIEPRPAQRSGLFVRLAYWFARRRLGKVPAPVGIMAHSPWVLAAVAGYELASERAGALDPRLKDLANLKVATEVGCRFCIDIGSAVASGRGAEVGCRFCIDIGSAVASGRGLREEELAALPAHAESPLFSLLDKLVLDYAVCMCRVPMVVPAQLSASLREKLGAQALVELTAVVAWENYRSRFNHAFGAEEEGFARPGAHCLLPPRAAGEPRTAGGLQVEPRTAP